MTLFSKALITLRLLRKSALYLKAVTSLTHMYSVFIRLKHRGCRPSLHDQSNRNFALSKAIQGTLYFPELTPIGSNWRVSQPCRQA